jgi:hypothetical protein
MFRSGIYIESETNVNCNMTNCMFYENGICTVEINTDKITPNNLDCDMNQED